MRNKIMAVCGGIFLILGGAGSINYFPMNLIACAIGGLLVGLSTDLQD